MNEPESEGPAQHRGDSRAHQDPNDPFSPRPIAAWYMLAAVASLLFFSFGCVVYLMRMLADTSTMPLDQQAAVAAVPAWVNGASAFNVWLGLAGAVLLLLKRRWAEPLLGLSLVGALAWLGGMIGVGRLREAMSATDLLVAMAMTAITWTVFWFARHSRQRGWLA